MYGKGIVKNMSTSPSDTRDMADEAISLAGR